MDMLAKVYKLMQHSDTTKRARRERESDIYTRIIQYYIGCSRYMTVHHGKLVFYIFF